MTPALYRPFPMPAPRWRNGYSRAPRRIVCHDAVTLAALLPPFPSILAAARFASSSSTRIADAARRGIVSAGYRWRFTRSRLKVKPVQKKPVTLMSPSDLVIGTWPSIQAAANDPTLGMTRRQIEYAIAIGRTGKRRRDGSLWCAAGERQLAA